MINVSQYDHLDIGSTFQKPPLHGDLVPNELCPAFSLWSGVKTLSPMDVAFSSLQILAWSVSLTFALQMASGKPSAHTWLLNLYSITGALVSPLFR